VVPRLDAEYVETGEVFYVFKFFPVLGVDSQIAAVVAACAGEQGRFWEMHDWLFTNKSTWANQSDAANIMIQGASQVGVDSTTLAECMTSGRMEARVQADFNEARRAGARGTPAFLVNGRLVPGFLPWEQWQPIIERALAEAGQ